MSREMHPEKDIIILNVIEHLRKRPGMYIVNSQEDGLNNLVFHFIYFLLIASPRGSQRIVLSLQAGNIISIELTEPSLFSGASSEWIITLFTKYLRKDSEQFKQLYQQNERIILRSSVAEMDHCIGFLAANAMSEYLILECKDGKSARRFTFNAGQYVKEEEVQEEISSVRISFKADPTIVNGQANYDKLANMLDQLMMFFPEARLTIADIRTELIVRGKQLYQGKEIHYPGGAEEYISQRSENGNKKVYSYTETYPSNNSKLSVHFSYNTFSEEGSVRYYINHLPMPMGGAHVDHFMQEYPEVIKRHSSVPFEDLDLNLNWNSISKGLTCIISLESARPEFEGATHSRGSDEHAVDLMDHILMRVEDDLEKLSHFE